MGLVPFVDDGSGGAETLPDGVAVLLGHGAQVFPLFVQFLQLLEGFHHILVLSQGFGRFAEHRLGFQILLEIEVAQFAVDVHQIIELGHIQLISIVDVAETLLGNRADLAPLVLDFTELGEGILHVAGLFHQGLQLFDDGLFLGQIFFPLGILLAVKGGTLLLVVQVQFLEAGLDGGEGAHRAALHGNGSFLYTGILVRLFHSGVFAGFGLLLGKPFIESGLDGLRLLGPFHTVFTFFQFLEQLG